VSGRLDRLEQGAFDALYHDTREQVRAQAFAGASDEELRALVYRDLAGHLGDSSFLNAALDLLDWDEVIERVCRVDTLELDSPCCRARLRIKTRGWLLATESGSGQAEEEQEQECPKCHRRYAVTIATRVKGQEHTHYELQFELLSERFTYVHTQSSSADGRMRSARHHWLPREDGTPVHPAR
jgi:hypothetical protein